MSQAEHIAGYTWHGRKGEIKNAFRYGVDFVMLDAEREMRSTPFFGRNRRGLFSLRDVDHGGAPGEGNGAAWVRGILAEYGLRQPHRIELLAQPRMMGYVFNPVSFWLCYDDAGDLRTVIAEVNNTYGDRHSYLCHRPNQGPITARDKMQAQKIFYVSPFQKVEGDYEFRFDIRPDRIAISIDYTRGKGGLVATLVGERKPLTAFSVVKAALRRPFGTRRVMALIHWQALKLWWKGAIFRTRPEPPVEEVSR
ncbi:MAG: DUF1365 domain-containing protein [Pseudomonadota bacterium]